MIINYHHCYDQYYQYQVMEINFGSVGGFWGLRPLPQY